MLVLGVLNNSPNVGYLTWIKPSNKVMLSIQKHVSNLPSYVDIINGIFSKLILKIETKNPDDTKIKDELVLHGITQAAADEIE